MIYHLSPNHSFVLDNLPEHKFIIFQCNLPRLKSKKRGRQKLAGVKGIESILKQRKYAVEVFRFNGYAKPIVVGIR